MSLVLRIMNRNPLISIIILGFSMILIGNALNDLELINWGKSLFNWGFIFQIFWIVIGIVLTWVSARLTKIIFKR